MSCEGVGVWVRKAPDRGKGRCKGAKGRSGEEMGSGGRRAAAMCPDEAECQQGPVMKGDMCLESHLDALLRKGDRTAMDSHGRRLLPQGNDEWRYFCHSAGPPDWMMKDTGAYPWGSENVEGEAVAGRVRDGRLLAPAPPRDVEGVATGRCRVRALMGSFLPLRL